MGINISTREAYGQALAEFGNDEKIYVLDSDLKSCTMSKYFADNFPERFFNMGIAEANMAGAAAGMATCGATSVIHTFAIFASGRIYDQIRNDIAYPKLNVKIVGSHAGLTVGEDGATHQALEDISLMRTMPGMTVVVPCDANETRHATKEMLKIKDPVYLRTGRGQVECVTDKIDGYNFKIGKGNLLRDGTDVTIIACGLMVQQSLKAADLLEKEGISARVIDMHTIKPIDKEIILKAAEETKAIVTAEEHSVIGGLGAAVAEVISANKPTPIEFIGVNDVYGHSGKPEELLEKYGLGINNIVNASKKVISRK